MNVTVRRPEGPPSGAELLAYLALAANAIKDGALEAATIDELAAACAEFKACVLAVERHLAGLLEADRRRMN